MSANSLQLLTSPEGHLLSAAAEGDGPSLTVERDTVDSGFQATLAFTRGSERLVVVSAIMYDAAKIVQSSITADGPGVHYRLTVDFAEDPAAFFSGSKLDAALTVDSDGVTHQGRLDGETWHPVGLEQAPRLPDLLTGGAGPLIAPLRPALDVLVAQFHRATGGTFPSTPGRPPTLALAGPGTIQTFSWWSERACKIGCAVAQLATAAACCAAVAGPSAGTGCLVCNAAAAMAGINCTENCSD
jgi:hypothetical protein